MARVLCFGTKTEYFKETQAIERDLRGQELRTLVLVKVSLTSSTILSMVWMRTPWSRSYCLGNLTWGCMEQKQATLAGPSSHCRNIRKMRGLLFFWTIRFWSSIHRNKTADDGFCVKFVQWGKHCWSFAQIPFAAWMYLDPRTCDCWLPTALQLELTSFPVRLGQSMTNSRRDEKGSSLISQWSHLWYNLWFKFLP